MKIAHILWSFNYGGIQTLLVDLMNQQVHDHSVHLFVINKNVSSSLINRLSNEVHVHLIGRRIGHLSIFKLLKFNIRLHTLNPEIIHCHFHNQVKLLFFFKKHRIHLTVHDVNYPLKNMKHYSRIYSISKSVQKDLLCRGKINSDVVYNGIDTDSIKTKDSYSGKVIKILQISRLVHMKKGQDILIRAFHYLLQKYNYENVELYFIGLGASYTHLGQLASDLGISSKVIFLGYKDRLYISEHLKDYDILVQPSRYEGFGITVIEAMTAGLPVLVSNIDGPMEIIQQGRYGYCFQNEDEISCAEQLNEIITMLGNRKYIDKAKEIREYVIENYSIKSVAFQYNKNYTNHSEA